MHTRRRLLVVLGPGTLLAAFPSLARPQERRVRRIGFFSAASVKSNAGRLDAFRKGMAELRWVEGRDYVIDARYANGVSQAVAGLADELVATGPDLLLTPADAAMRVLAERTKTIPIVFATASDPVGQGVAASLQRPGGNLTGLTTMARELGPKRLQFLKEAFPRVAHVVVLFDPGEPLGPPQVKEIEEAAPRLGIRVTPVELRQAADIEPAFRRGAASGVHAYVLIQSFLMNVHRQAIADRISRAKVPAIFPDAAYVEAGGLMSYASSWPDSFRRAAAYVDKILKGAKPGDLPIEQPTKFELMLNLKTAKAMGITFPRTILLRADRVIE